MRHPRDMGTAEVEAFLNMLANERQISPSIHNQALSALLFLHREVMAVDLPWLNGLNRPAQKRRIPSVLTREEVDVAAVAGAGAGAQGEGASTMAFEP
jgi:hypothetical protein